MKTPISENTRDRDDVLSQLLEKAPARPQPGAQAKDDAFRALHTQWTMQVSEGRRRRRHVVYALAATVVVGIGAVFMLPPATSTPVQVATFERIDGPAPRTIDNDGQPTATGGDSSVVMSGQTVVTGPSTRVALAWHDGGSIRLDANSRVEWLSDTEIRLIGGAMYFDSGATPNGTVPSPTLDVHTAAGVVSHLGTQYLVEQAGNQVAVQVREGRVLLKGDQSKTTIRSGQRLDTSVRGDESWRPVDRYDEVWQWAIAVAPPFSAQPTSSALELIDWIAREMGYSVVYEPGARSQALATGLINFGSLSASSNTIAVIQSATNLSLDVTGDQIRVSVRSTAP